MSIMLHCRECGTEIDSGSRQATCKKCGTMFPFACAVCGKLLRPPIPEYPVERFFTEKQEPLCEEHYQRQCPECGKWFQADANPGYFLCKECTAKRGSMSSAGSTAGSDGGTDTLGIGEAQPEVERPASRAVKRSREPDPAPDPNGDAAPGRAADQGGTRKGCGAGVLFLATATGLSVYGIRILLGL